MAPQTATVTRKTARFSLDDFIASKPEVRVAITSRPVRLRNSGIVALPNANYDLSILVGKGFLLEVNLEHEHPVDATSFGCARILYSTGTPTGYELGSCGDYQYKIGSEDWYVAGIGLERMANYIKKHGLPK